MGQYEENQCTGRQVEVIHRKNGESRTLSTRIYGRTEGRTLANVHRLNEKLWRKVITREKGQS